LVEVDRNSITGNTASDGDVHMRKEINSKDDYVEPNEERKTRTRMAKRQTEKEGE